MANKSSSKNVVIFPIAGQHKIQTLSYPASMSLSRAPSASASPPVYSMLNLYSLTDSAKSFAVPVSLENQK